jgi:hypothetical protein
MKKYNYTLFDTAGLSGGVEDYAVALPNTKLLLTAGGNQIHTQKVPRPSCKPLPHQVHSL